MDMTNFIMTISNPVIILIIREGVLYRINQMGTFIFLLTVEVIKVPVLVGIAVMMSFLCLIGYVNI